jgi:hypothetical protein
MSPEEIAARENPPVKLPTVLKSIERMKAYAAEFSAESTDLATREVYMRKLGDAAEVLTRALTATRNQATTRIVTRRDHLTGDTLEEAVVFDEVVPDIPVQLKGMEALQKLLAAVQPKQPMVSVDARSQTNIGTGGGGGGGLGAGQGSLGAGQPLSLSAESMIRRVRAQAGLSLPSGNETGVVTAVMAPLVERDSELDELLAEDDEDGEADEADDTNDSATLDDETDPA